MKYTLSAERIPQAQRREVNEKILYLIGRPASERAGITAEDIFNAYTGDGGLHGLNRGDFANYHAFSEAKKEVENGQFFTPPSVCRFMVECMDLGPHDVVADLTCGMGNFFNYVPTECNAWGCELDAKAAKVAQFLYPEAHIERGDMRDFTPSVKFDVVFGNPPFNLWLRHGGAEHRSQFLYCLLAAQWLKPGGFLFAILPTSFMADEWMDKHSIEAMDDRFDFVAQFDLPANAFAPLGVANFATKAAIFQRRSECFDHVPYTPAVESVPLTDAGVAQVRRILAPFKERKVESLAKLHLENVRASGNADFAYQVRKWLFIIRQHPRLKARYAECEALLEQLRTQRQPEGMPWAEWDVIRLTESKVLAHLASVVRQQHVVPRDEIRLVKAGGRLRLKGYSPESVARAAREAASDVSIASLVVEGYYPFADQTFAKLIRRKRAEYQRQSQSFKSMRADAKIARFLRRFRLTDASTGEVLALNAIQRGDMNKLMQKRYGILNFQQGSGKTLCAIAWYKRLLTQAAVRNIVVVSSALSINLTWAVRLKHYGEPFIFVKSVADIRRIRPGQVVLVTFDLLGSIQHAMKAWVKSQSGKLALIVDESDEMTNHASQRTRAALNCFRRLPFKLLTTGTTTRNSIHELYAQIELLYNNSWNMICECPEVFKYNREGELEPEANPHYGQPFPARGGNRLFKACFSPAKATVFGVRKHNQDIYHAAALRRLIEKTIITRKFAEVCGEKKYEVITHRIAQNAAERAVYEKIMQEFHEMLYLFQSTGNSRKDSMLRIIRQIQLLIKTTSVPHRFKEYEGTDLPRKIEFIARMIDRFDEKVAVGVTTLDAVDVYRGHLTRTFPDRPLFVIRGDVSFKARKKLIAQFEASSNGILLSTQQSLKNSVSIPTCNKVIVESLQWNVPKMEQFYFRFIRFDSRDQKQVHFVTYNHTIEQNILALLMAKERVNEFIKTLVVMDESDVFEEFGLDASIFDAIIEKEKDEEGRVRLTWGNQTAQC